MKLLCTETNASKFKKKEKRNGGWAEETDGSYDKRCRLQI